MATGALNAQGVWIYGEDDSETTFSALLNKLGNSVTSNLKGKILQQTYSTATYTISSASATPVTTGLTASINPISSTSKIIVIFNINGIEKGAADSTCSGTFNLYKNGSALQEAGEYVGYGMGNVNLPSVSNVYSSTSGSTSAQTYTIMFQRTTGSGSVYVQANATASTMLILEVSA